MEDCIAWAVVDAWAKVVQKFGTLARNPVLLQFPKVSKVDPHSGIGNLLAVPAGFLCGQLEDISNLFQFMSLQGLVFRCICGCTNFVG